jgi:hypothetical protein
MHNDLISAFARGELVEHLAKFVAMPDLTSIFEVAGWFSTGAIYNGATEESSREFIHRQFAEIDWTSRADIDRVLRVCDVALLDRASPAFTEAFAADFHRSKERMVSLLAYEGYLWEDGRLVDCK